MAGKFVELKEAAKMIGVSPDELVEMRSRGDIFGYRDGASWKFKLEEVERVTSERAAGSRIGDSGVMGGTDEEFDSFASGLSSKILAEKAQEESESVLISEEELGLSATGQSTIIGKGLKPEGSATSESDLRLATEESGTGILGGNTGSDKLLEAPGSRMDAAAASDVLHGSDLNLTSGSGTGDMPQAPGQGSGAVPLGNGLSLGEDDDLEIGSDSAIDDDIRLDKTAGGTGSGIGSDVTLGTGDSGINLAPTDSGLSLEEEPLDLGGSGVESLELPEDEEVISLEQEADPDQATQLKADNEFLLSPSGEATDDESDSGSQVIALEDSEAFDQDAATMLKSEPGGALAADAFQPIGGDMAMAGMGGAMQPGMATQPVYVQVPVVETPYSIWNVLALGLVVMLLSLCGMMMVDVMLNMWSFGGTTSVSTGIADGILSIMGQ